MLSSIRGTHLHWWGITDGIDALKGEHICAQTSTRKTVWLPRLVKVYSSLITRELHNSRLSFMTYPNLFASPSCQSFLPFAQMQHSLNIRNRRSIISSHQQVFFIWFDILPLHTLHCRAGLRNLCSHWIEDHHCRTWVTLCLQINNIFDETSKHPSHLQHFQHTWILKCMGLDAVRAVAFLWGGQNPYACILSGLDVRSNARFPCTIGAKYTSCTSLHFGPL